MQYFLEAYVVVLGECHDVPRFDAIVVLRCLFHGNVDPIALVDSVANICDHHLAVVQHFSICDEPEAVDFLPLSEDSCAFRQVCLLKQVDDFLQFEVRQLCKESETLEETDFLVNFPLLGFL